MNLEQAILKLKNLVKFSHLINQKHLDLTLVGADERYDYESALIIARKAVKEGQLSEQDLKKKLGLV